MDPLNLTIKGRANTTDLAKNERFVKAFTSFVQDLESIGCKIETGQLEHAGNTTDVLAAVHAGA
jgi:hypothetical protein